MITQPIFKVTDSHLLVKGSEYPVIECRWTFDSELAFLTFAIENGKTYSVSSDRNIEKTFSNLSGSIKGIIK